MARSIGRRAALAAAEREAYNATNAAALEVEGALQTVEESVDALARSVAELQPRRDALERLLDRFTSDQAQLGVRYEVIESATDPRASQPWYQDTVNRGAAGWPAGSRWHCRASG